MEDLYSIHPGIGRSSQQDQVRSMEEEVEEDTDEGDDEDIVPDAASLSEQIKAHITGHPRYPSLVAAYIACRKVGAPPELASLLEEIGKDSCCSTSAGSEQLGVDPELDDFMEAYCQVLGRYKEELSRPLDEATSFLSRIQTQLTDLCNPAAGSVSRGATASSTVTTAMSTDDVTGSDEELNCEEVEAVSGNEGGSPQMGDRELKAMLLRKYSGHLSSLRNEFLKTRKKGKLPKDARLALLDWWNSHNRWPYPTEEDKAKLAERTGLDQKQINNWFINQRKRHWKPSEDMRFALMEKTSGESSGTTLHFDSGTIGP